jgi:Predicted redox protein, regulator of disulfide bond formation
MITSKNLPAHYLTNISDGKHDALTDAPEAMGGQSAGFKPVELLEAALSSCINIVLRVSADARAIPLTGITVRVKLNTEKKDESVFEYSIDMQGDLTEAQRATLLHAVAGCPVKKILSSAISFKEIAG